MNKVKGKRFEDVREVEPISEGDSMTMNIWISMNLKPRKTVCKQWTVCRIRDVFVKDTGLTYINTNQFRKALIECGYELTGCYIHASSRSRAFDSRKDQERSML